MAIFLYLFYLQYKLLFILKIERIDFEMEVGVSSVLQPGTT